MRKVIDYVKQNKKIIIVVLLIAILIGAVYLINKSTKSSTNTAGNSTRSETENKLTGILSHIEGAGNTDVMITENDGEILGVVIVCEGANNLMTRSNILNAVSTALKIDKKIIAIYSMTV